MVVWRAQGFYAAVDAVIAAIKGGGDVRRVEDLLAKAPPGTPYWIHDDETLLIMAARASTVDVARLLVGRGCPVDYRSSRGTTAVIEAVVAGKVGAAGRAHFLSRWAG